MTIQKPASKPAKRARAKTLRAKRVAAPEKSIWDKLLERAARIPDEELARHPTAGARNLHHYLHGHPKRED